MKTISITFHQGTTTVEANGFQGKGCTDATKQIEKALGLVTATKKKPQYHATGTVAQTQHQST